MPRTTMTVEVNSGMFFETERASALLAAERVVGAIGDGVLVTVYADYGKQVSMVVPPETTALSLCAAVQALIPQEHAFVLKMAMWGSLMEDRTTVALAMALEKTPSLRLATFPESMVKPNAR